jgi:hypothetical protein
VTRVAVIGNHQHHHCSEAQWARAFAEIGCDVTPLQIDDVVQNADTAMRVLRAQDLICYTRTHAPGRFLDERWTARWRELERCGVRTVGLHLDRFFDLEREPLIHEGDAQFTVGTLWTADGGNDERWRAAGVNHRWLMPAVDPDDVQGGQHQRDLAYDVVFVGSGGTYHNAYPERLQLIAHLRRTYGRRFAHYGHGGDHPVVRGKALNDVYASAKVVVGDACFANSGPSQRPVNYWSDRVVETIGRGGFLIHPWVRGLDQCLTTGIHFVTHNPGDWEDLDCQIGAYLASSGERVGIAETGQAHVLKNHTWAHRCADILASVGLAPEVVSSAASGNGLR